jgi:cytoskeleton protein RodZ
MKKTGEILKKAREKKGLSINEIALSLKISSKILKSIEEGDISQLPAKTFLRGFVQSYANYLRVDVNEVLRLFQEEMGSTKPSPLIQMPEQDETLESFEKKSSDNQTPRASSAANDRTYTALANKNSNTRTISFTVIGVVLVGLIIFTKKMIDKYQKEGAVSEVEVTDPLATSSETSPDAAPSDEAAAALIQTSPSPAASAAMSLPVATPTPMMSATPTPLASPSLTPKSSVTPTPKATVSPTPTATPSATPTPTASPSAAASPSPSVSPSPTPANKPVEVIIEALDNVEIDYFTKDGKSEKITLSAEQVHTFKSKAGLRLNISNGGAVNVIVNGKDLGIPGNLGKPVKLIF